MITNQNSVSADKPEINSSDLISQDCHIVVIGTSAGGFEAIKKIVSDLPSDFRQQII